MENRILHVYLWSTYIDLVTSTASAQFMKPSMSRHVLNIIVHHAFEPRSQEHLICFLDLDSIIANRITFGTPIYRYSVKQFN